MVLKIERIAEDLVGATDITKMTYSWAKCVTCSPRSCRGSARRIRAASWEGSALGAPEATIHVLFFIRGQIGTAMAQLLRKFVKNDACRFARRGVAPSTPAP